MWCVNQQKGARTYAEAKAANAICGDDGPNALRQAHLPMDRRSLGVLTSDGPDLCEAIGAISARHRRSRRHGDRPGCCLFRCDRSLHPATDARAVDGRVRQRASGLQDRDLIAAASLRLARLPADRAQFREFRCVALNDRHGQRRSPKQIKLALGGSRAIADVRDRQRPSPLRPYSATREVRPTEPR